MLGALLEHFFDKVFCEPPGSPKHPKLIQIGRVLGPLFVTFSEEADIEKMTTVLHFHYILVIRGSKKEVPKTSEKQFLKKDTNKSEKVSLWGSIWEAVGRLFGIIFACQFLAEKRHPLGRPACGVKGLTGGLKTAT